MTRCGCVRRTHGGKGAYDYRFVLGRAALLCDGADVLIIAWGVMTMRVLEAAEALRLEGIEAAVLHSPALKPLDRDTILREAACPGQLLVAAENHPVVGGLREAVAALLLSAGVAPTFWQVGLPDEFLAAGALPSLHERSSICAAALRTSIKHWLSR